MKSDLIAAAVTLVLAALAYSALVKFAPVNDRPDFRDGRWQAPVSAR